MHDLFRKIRKSNERTYFVQIWVYLHFYILAVYIFKLYTVQRCSDFDVVELFICFGPIGQIFVHLEIEKGPEMVRIKKPC